MAKYIIQGETLKAIADEVRDLTDITDEINPSEMIANMEQANADVAAQTEIIEQIRTALDGKAGSNAVEIGVLIDRSGVLDSTEGTVEEKVEQLVDKAESENIWYVASKHINFTNQNSPFCGVRGTEKTIPRINFPENGTTNYAYSFSGGAIEYIDYYMDTKKGIDFGSCFSTCKKLTRLVGINTLSATNITEMFLNCTSLESITEPFNISKVTEANKTFNNCAKLKDIRFVAETIKVSISFPSSSLLTAESIQSIIDGLATVETARTLTLHANTKILQSQVDSANAKGWTIAGGTVISEEEYYG